MTSNLPCLFRLLLVAIGVTPGAPAAASANQVSVLKGVSYETPAGPRKMDIYGPGTAVPGGAPGLVWIGRDEPGARDGSVCGDLAGSGFVVALIKSEPGNTPSDQPVVIAKCAVRFIRASAAKFHLDGNRIAIAGASHAGTYALLVGFTRNEPRFSVKDAFYPGVSDEVKAVVTLSARTDWRVPEVKGWPAAALEELRVLSPVTYVTPDAPAVLMFHGRGDKVVAGDNATTLEKILAKNRVPHRLVLLDGVGHTYSLTAANGRPLPEDVKGICVSFLQTYLKPPQ